MPSPNIDAEFVVPLENRWEAIDNAREQIAAELELMTSDFSGEGKSQLRSLSNWFRHNANFESALQRPDVLAICLSLINIESAPLKPITNDEIVQATRIGFCRWIPRPHTAARHVIGMLIYPLLILLAAWLLWIAFCFYLVPQFEDMFNNFGVDLPPATLTLFRLSRFVRNWWWLMLSAPFVSLALLWLFNRSTIPAHVSNRSSLASFLDHWLMGSRQAVAIWAWHLSLLLHVGIVEDAAIRIACSVSKKPWLRRTSFERAQHQRANSKNNSANSGLAYDSRPTFQFPNSSRYGLLNRILELPAGIGKITMLGEASTYYWERSRSLGDWWIRWLAMLIIWFVGGMVLLVALGLFVPLLSFIGALSGGGLW